MPQETVQPKRTGALPWQTWQQSLGGETFEFEIFPNSRGIIPLSVRWVVNDTRIPLVSDRPLFLNQDILATVKWHPVVQALGLTLTPEAEGDVSINEETIGRDVRINAHFSIDPINRHTLRTMRKMVANGEPIPGLEA